MALVVPLGNVTFNMYAPSLSVVSEAGHPRLGVKFTRARRAGWLSLVMVPWIVITGPGRWATSNVTFCGAIRKLPSAIRAVATTICGVASSWHMAISAQANAVPTL